MFISEKARGEAQELFAKNAPCAPNNITKLSQAILVGSSMVLESRTWSGCALAAAAVGAGYTGHMAGYYILSFLQERFGTSITLLHDISTAHCHGVSREIIAAQLEKQGL